MKKSSKQQKKKGLKPSKIAKAITAAAISPVPPIPVAPAPAIVPSTRVERPFAVSRTVSGRLIAEFNAKGELRIKAANGIDLLLGTQVLAPGEKAVATFKLASKWHCGAAIFQPAGWTVGCDGEMSLTLGNVDFPYLNDSGYVAKDQMERYETIEITFVYPADRQGWIEGFVGEGSDFHGVKSMTPKTSPATPNTPEKIGSHSVAFIAFSELSAVDPDDIREPKDAKLTRLPSGGTVTITTPAGAKASFNVF